MTGRGGETRDGAMICARASCALPFCTLLRPHCRPVFILMPNRKASALLVRRALPRTDITTRKTTCKGGLKSVCPTRAQPEAAPRAPVITSVPRPESRDSPFLEGCAGARSGAGERVGESE